jgi:hypothetical protein
MILGEIPMRRPLDWIVVAISLTVLFANRMLTASAPEMLVRSPEIQAIVTDAAAAEPASPFAYIREDGSEIFLPVAGPRVAGPASPERSPTANALYTWSSPLIADKKAPSFQ